MTRRWLIAGTDRSTPAEWADTCLTRWRGQTLPLPSVLARLAEGCQDTGALCFALVHTLGTGSAPGSPRPGGAIFTCGGEAIVVYPQPGLADPASSQLTRAEAWFLRHRQRGPLEEAYLEEWDAGSLEGEVDAGPLEGLPLTTAPEVREALTGIVKVYLRAHEEAGRAPAVVAATERLDALQHSDPRGDVIGVEEARNHRQQAYWAAERLARRRLLDLSMSSVARL